MFGESEKMSCFCFLFLKQGENITDYGVSWGAWLKPAKKKTAGIRVTIFSSPVSLENANAIYSSCGHVYFFCFLFNALGELQLTRDYLEFPKYALVYFSWKEAVKSNVTIWTRARSRAPVQNIKKSELIRARKKSRKHNNKGLSSLYIPCIYSHARWELP